MCGKKDEKTELYQEIKSANKMVLAKMSITKPDMILMKIHLVVELSDILMIHT